MRRMHSRSCCGRCSRVVRPRSRDESPSSPGAEDEEKGEEEEDGRRLRDHMIKARGCILKSSPLYRNGVGGGPFRVCFFVDRVCGQVGVPRTTEGSLRGAGVRIRGGGSGGC